MLGKLTPRSDIPAKYINSLLLKEGFYGSCLNPHLFVQEEIEYALSDFEFDEFPYGICDEPEQFINKFEKIIADHKDTFVVTFTLIAKKDQPKQDGWRWGKWGPYIGNKIPQFEYLYDEPEIEEVVIYAVWKVLEN
jgi:hypothetical protein